ncbi:MAG: DUF5320 domain-containing protein [Clostridiaceae bacterium]|jgi:hypothetical protein|nr:DUF5320 domain-containing protein [Clostridiaceae bacterium]
MKKKRLLILISVVTVLLVGITTVSYAATAYRSPAEIIAGLTDKSVDQVVADRQAGITYGAQAVEAEKLDEFRLARLELKKQNLDRAVAEKRLSQADADKIHEAMKMRLADCTGDGTGQGPGPRMGKGLGKDSGAGQGAGLGMGKGSGKNFGAGPGSDIGDRGMGRGTGNGTCAAAGRNGK